MYRNILVSLDLDDASDLETTLGRASELCRAFPGTRLHAVTVLPTFGMSIVGSFFPSDYEKKASEALMKRLREEVDARLPEGLRCQHIVAEGKVYEAVLRTAREIAADLIVIGAHRPELSDYLLGPNAARVVRHATCSVLVVRD